MYNDEFVKQLKKVEIKACAVCKHFLRGDVLGNDNEYHGRCNYNDMKHPVDIDNICDNFYKRITPKEFIERYNCTPKADPPKTCPACKHNINVEIHKSGNRELIRGECEMAISFRAYYLGTSETTVCDLFTEKINE